MICDALEVESEHDTDMTKKGLKKFWRNLVLKRTKKIWGRKCPQCQNVKQYIEKNLRFRNIWSQTLSEIFGRFFGLRREWIISGETFPAIPNTEERLVCSVLAAGPSRRPTPMSLNATSMPISWWEKNLSDDRDLVKFYRDVMKRRETIEEKKKMKKS